MNLLSIDPGMAACGWAVFGPADLAMPVAVGVITTEHDAGVDRTIDHQRRIMIVGAELRAIVQDYACTSIAAEDMLAHGSVHAVIPQVLCWGVITQLAEQAGAELVSVLAKDWQRAVEPRVRRVKKKQRYPLVEKKLKAHLGALLALIESGLQTHAIDAAGVGIYANLRPSSKRRITRSAR